MKQGEQESTEELEQRAKNVETFNPWWSSDGFTGPNTLRQERDIDVYGEEES